MASMFSAATFRTLGNAATTQNIFSLHNTAGAAKNLYVRRLLFQMDVTAVLTTFMPIIKTHRVSGAVPSGGTAIAKGLFDTNVSSIANAVALGATASDGGVATAITATPGIVAWQQYGMRMHTLVGQVIGVDSNMLPALVDTAGYEFVLRAGEGLVMQIVAAAGTSNPATNHYFAECVWEEL